MGNKKSAMKMDTIKDLKLQNPISEIIDTRRIFSPDYIEFPLTKFPSLMKIYQNIEPKQFNFTLINPTKHHFSSSKVVIFLNHSYLSITDANGKKDHHDYFHIHSWGEKKNKYFGIKYIDALDKHQMYVFKSNKKYIELFQTNILKIINLIMKGYKINNNIYL